MKFFLVIALLSSYVCPTFGQERVDITDELNRRQQVALAELEKLEDSVENPGSGGENFIFVVAIPSTIAAITDFILLAAAASYVSAQLSEDLNLRLDNLDDNFQSLRAKVNELWEIYTIAKKSKDRTLSNVDKLRGIGYTNSQLEELAQSISRNNKKCSDKQNNNSPDNFCPDYKNNFNRDGYKIEKVGGGYLVKKKGKFQCCLEWDRDHCGFEIFDKRGRHKGEVGCLADEFDPCSANSARGTHALPQTDHRPRSQRCKKN